MIICFLSLLSFNHILLNSNTKITTRRMLWYVCASVREDNPHALAIGLLYVRTGRQSTSVQALQ